MKQVLAHQLADWLADTNRPNPILLDVREPWEIELCQIAGSQCIPMHLVPMQCEDLDPEQEIVVICHHGGRSMQVAMFLERKGYTNVFNLMGGVDPWAGEVDPTMRRY